MSHSWGTLSSHIPPQNQISGYLYYLTIEVLVVGFPITLLEGYTIRVIIFIGMGGLDTDKPLFILVDIANVKVTEQDFVSYFFSLISYGHFLISFSYLLLTFYIILIFA